MTESTEQNPVKITWDGMLAGLTERLDMEARRSSDLNFARYLRSGNPKYGYARRPKSAVRSVAELVGVLDRLVVADDAGRLREWVRELRRALDNVDHMFGILEDDVRSFVDDGPSEEERKATAEQKLTANALVFHDAATSRPGRVEDLLAQVLAELKTLNAAHRPRSFTFEGSDQKPDETRRQILRDLVRRAGLQKKAGA
ncbi:MAG: hypothetical protein QM809_11350 [Gordonia sp. (in: high G+C Gram-positive bacteria)]|uniref:hypothetical protein n=1 Tax=Gordonia sp. (in: high G+C Gram-positive bacteria) TaxID=84139 RepID=UPI0039E25F11